MTKWQIVILTIGVAYAFSRAYLRWRRSQRCVCDDEMLSVRFARGETPGWQKHTGVVEEGSFTDKIRETEKLKHVRLDDETYGRNG